MVSIMGCNFISKIRDRVAKPWRNGFESLLLPLLPTLPTRKRVLIRAVLCDHDMPSEGDHLLIRPSDAGGVDCIKGLVRIAHCQRPPDEVRQALLSDPESIFYGIIRRIGVLLRTIDIELLAAPSSEI